VGVHGLKDLRWSVCHRLTAVVLRYMYVCSRIKSWMTQWHPSDCVRNMKVLFHPGLVMDLPQVRARLAQLNFTYRAVF
jgi:hypothetical protein